MHRFASAALCGDVGLCGEVRRSLVRSEVSMGAGEGFFGRVGGVGIWRVFSGGGGGGGA